MYNKRYRTIVALIALSLGLSGCLAQSQVQAKYMQKENDCREEAQNRVANSQQTGMSSLGYDTQVETAYTLASGFSECMNKQGWKVAVPKPPGTPPTNTASNTTPPPSGAPGPGGTVAALRTAPANPTVQAVPVQTNPKIGVQGTNQAPPYSSTRPYGTYMPQYGTGAGRQF